MTLPESESESESDTAARPAFPQARGREKGYDPRAVDAFLERARRAFESGPTADPHPDPDATDPVATDGEADAAPLTAAEVRATAFPLIRHGYAIGPVDAALGRVEDAFAAREREQALAAEGSAAYVEEVRTEAQVVLDRLTRPRRRRFDRTSALRYGYRIDEVDLVADKLAAFLAEGAPVTADQVRAVAFRMQRGGYRETQVDAVLDAVIEIMLAVA